MYKKVWRVPLRHLAIEYQISDVGLAKVLKRFQIPRPPAGYWMMKPDRQKREQKPLPKVSEEFQEVWFTSGLARHVEDQIDESHPQLMVVSKFDFNQNKSLSNGMLRSVLSGLRKMKKDKYGVVKQAGIRVSKPAIVDLKPICNFLSQLSAHQGWDLSKDKSGLVINAEHGSFTVEINERIRRSDNPDYLDWEARRNLKNFDLLWVDKWQYHATGELWISIEGKKFTQKKSPITNQAYQIVKFTLEESKRRQQLEEKRRLQAEQLMIARRKEADRELELRLDAGVTDLLIAVAEKSDRWKMVSEYIDDLRSCDDEGSNRLLKEFEPRIEALKPPQPSAVLQDLIELKSRLEDEKQRHLDPKVWNDPWR
ncbi:MAG: hypothetical protein JJ934_13025 [Pseudomonadales bacterium]|nr:hypothetical protein [Pseudomonadales bacterium]